MWFGWLDWMVVWEEGWRGFKEEWGVMYYKDLKIREGLLPKSCV